MSYRALVNGDLFFNTNSIDQMFALSSATLELKAGAAGLFSFTVLPTNKYYDEFSLLSDYIDVYRNDDLIFSGRVSSISQAFNLSYKIEAQGLLSIFNDTIFRPIIHEGSLYQLLSELLSSHNAQVESSKEVLLGNIQIPNRDPCYRAYQNYESTLSRLNDLVDSFGGYLSIRKHADHLYLDWKNITTLADQSIDFGENLIDITKGSETENYITVLIPLGAEVEDETTGERTRLTIESVNQGLDYIVLSGATNKIVGTYTWDDVTEPDNLLSRGQAYLNAQGVLKTTIDVTAIDLADAGYNIDNFSIGTIIEVTSRPHGLENQTFECLSQSLDLLSPDSNKLTLGGVVDGFTLKAKKEAKLNTKIIERIEANYTTNSRLNEIKSTLDRKIQENYTSIVQNSESITLLAEQVTTAAKIFYEDPVPPYSEGDLWYRGHTSEDIYSAVPGYAIPGRSIPGTGGDLYICTKSKADGELFDISDWKATFEGQLTYINKRITSAKIEIDSTKGQIALVATDVNKLIGRVRSAELDIDANNASITAVTRNVDALSGRVSTAELKISANDASIRGVATDVNSLTDRVSTAELDIDAANEEIALKVSNSDYTAAKIVAKINGAESTVTIGASHIKLEGVVTANNGFKIDNNGYVTISNTKGSQTGQLYLGGGSYYAGTGSSPYTGPAVVMKSKSSSNTAGNTVSIYCSDNGPGLIEAFTKGGNGLEIGSLSQNQASDPVYTTNMYLGHSSIYFCFEPQVGAYYSTNRLMTLNQRYVNGTRSGGSLTTDGLWAGDISGTTLSISSGTKKKLVQTTDYGERSLYCYEMAQPIFGDMGHGMTDDNGECIVYLDDIFAETICQDIEYSIFVQAESDGHIWVAEKTKYYFVIRGDSGVPFTWELKAVQIDYDTERLEETASPEIDGDEFSFVNDTYWVDLTKYMPEQEEILPDFDVEQYIKEQEDLLEEDTDEAA